MAQDQHLEKSWLNIISAVLPWELEDLPSPQFCHLHDGGAESTHFPRLCEKE